MRILAIEDERLLVATIYKQKPHLSVIMSNAGLMQNEDICQAIYKPYSGNILSAYPRPEFLYRHHYPKTSETCLKTLDFGAGHVYDCSFFM